MKRLDIVLIYDPFETHKEVLDFDIIKSKLYKLQELVASDKVFAQRLSREGETSGCLKSDAYDIHNDNLATCDNPEDSHRCNDLELVQGKHLIPDHSHTESSYNSGDKKLEREVMMKRLKYEIDRRKLLLENSELESNKLKLETELVKLQIEQTKVDIAIKHHELRQRGIPIDPTFLSS